MNEQINVRSVDTLERLHAELKRFAHDAPLPLQAAAGEIHRTLEWLGERRGYWQARVQFFTLEVERARRAYEACLQSGARDARTGQYSQPDCSPQYEAMEKAQALLREATTELAKVTAALRTVQQAVEAYERQARRLSGMLGADVPRGIAMLGRSIERLRTFIALSVQHNWSVAHGSTVMRSDAAPGGNVSDAAQTGPPRIEAIASPTVQAEPWAEYTFHDAGSRTLLVLGHVVGDKCYIRAHDLGIKDDVPRDRPSVGTGGYANVVLERNERGDVTGARLQDIMVTPSHRLGGIGSQLLEEAERFARDQHAPELHGEAPVESNVQEWYERRGYASRSTDGMPQIFKQLAE